MAFLDFRFPENTPTTLYLPAASGIKIGDMLDQMRTHFSIEDIRELRVSSEHIQVRGFDDVLDDGSDGIEYFVITR